MFCRRPQLSTVLHTNVRKPSLWLLSKSQSRLVGLLFYVLSRIWNACSARSESGSIRSQPRRTSSYIFSDCSVAFLSGLASPYSPSAGSASCTRVQVPPRPNSWLLPRCRRSLFRWLRVLHLHFWNSFKSSWLLSFNCARRLLIVLRLLHSLFFCEWRKALLKLRQSSWCIAWR